MNLGANLRINKCGWFTIIFVLFLIVYLKADLNFTRDKSKVELVSIKSMLKAGILAAELGGLKVVDGKKHNLNTKIKGKTKEGANDPVTDADYASNCVMYYSLKKTFPKTNIVSEENASSDTDCQNQQPLDTVTPIQQQTDIEDLLEDNVYAEDVTFWIDPLDATQEYTEDLTQYVTTMVCIAIRGVPIVGIIHFPFSSETYWGWSTKKSSENIKYVTNEVENKKHPRVMVSRSHAGDVKVAARNAFGENVEVTPAGGAGYKVMKVVKGEADVYMHMTAIKKWDICAGNAIINTVHGKMTTMSGQNIEYLPDGDVKNTKGLLVTLYDHDYYLNKTSKLPVI